MSLTSDHFSIIYALFLYRSNVYWQNCLFSFKGTTTRTGKDGTVLCLLLCNIERTQESMSEWRCDLARWEVESAGLSANKHQTLLFDAQNQTWQYLTMQAPRSWEKDRTTQLWVKQLSPTCEICRIIGWENASYVNFADGGRRVTGFSLIRTVGEENFLLDMDMEC